MVNPMQVFSKFYDAASFAKEKCSKFGKSFLVRRVGDGWGVFDASDIPNQLEMAAEMPMKQTEQYWSDGQPIEKPPSDPKTWEWRLGATTIKSDVYLKENGQPGDYRPDSAPVCYICGGSGTGHGGRACSRCHGFGYTRK